MGKSPRRATYVLYYRERVGRPKGQVVPRESVRINTSQTSTSHRVRQSRTRTRTRTRTTHTHTHTSTHPHIHTMRCDTPKHPNTRSYLPWTVVASLMGFEPSPNSSFALRRCAFMPPLLCAGVRSCHQRIASDTRNRLAYLGCCLVCHGWRCWKCLGDEGLGWKEGSV